MKKTFYALLSAALMLLCVSGIFAQGRLSITAPASIAGDYFYIQATFGPALNGASISGELDFGVYDDGMGNDVTNGCNPLANDLTGKIALIDRGGCAFVTKATNAQNAGATAVVVCNNDSANPDALGYMGGDDMGTLTIPAVMISYGDCQTIRAELPGVMGTANPPAAGEACFTAINLPSPGTYTASPITSIGATIGTGTGAQWYSYTPSADGSVNVNSCGGGVNTVVGIMDDDCPLPGLIVANDDACDDGAGGMTASNVDFLGLQGVTYYIQWTDQNSADGFDFEVALNALPTIDVTMTVDMLFETVAGDGVFIVGNFNNWTPTVMTDNGDGTWSYTTSVTSLDEVLWNYQNGMGNTENTADLSDCGTDDGSGGFNRSIVAASLTNINLGSTCYASCADCIPTDCNDPIELIDENFDAMTAGMTAADQSDDFAPWPGGTPSLVSDEQANSGANSLKIDGTPTTEDNLVLLGDKTSGNYKISFNVYAGAGMGWYFNIQKDQNNPGDEYAMQCDCETTGVGVLDAGAADAVTFDCSTRDEWVAVVIYVDLDNDWARLFINNEHIYSWPYNWTTFTMSGVVQLGSVNLFPIDANYIFYVDDFVFAAVPPASAGGHCGDPIAAVEGTNTIAGPIECFGGHDPEDAEGAVWYTYTAAADGVLAISSCGGGVDTRGWIFEGDCQALPIAGVNDDQCEVTSGGNEWASYREALVTGGQTYFIMWDNVWETAGFDWELTFTAGAGEAGNFCATAVAIQPGTHTVGTIDGNAAVTGPIIGNTSQGSTPTPYAKSEWYSFTPSEAGLMNITACDLTTEDTRLWVYTGTCDNLGTLNLIAASDDDCGVSGGPSAVTEVPVVGGTTYYIEWDDIFTTGNFDFELDLVITRQVTFIVNMERETVDIPNGGARIAGSWANWADEAMTNNFDGSWQYTTELRQGVSYQFKYQNGTGNWEDDSDLGDCGVDDGFGGFNREVTVGSMDMVLDTVCFSYCVNCDMVISVDETEFLEGLNLNPNPATTSATLTYSFDEALNLTIEVFDITGKLMRAEQVDNAQTGHVLLDVANFNPGVYQVRISSEQHQVSKKLVVHK